MNRFHLQLIAQKWWPPLCHSLNILQQGIGCYQWSHLEFQTKAEAIQVQQQSAIQTLAWKDLRLQWLQFLDLHHQKQQSVYKQDILELFNHKVDTYILPVTVSMIVPQAGHFLYPVYFNFGPGVSHASAAKS